MLQMIWAGGISLSRALFDFWDLFGKIKSSSLGIEYLNGRLSEIKNMR